MKYKRARKTLKQELRELDYIADLSPEEREFILKFYFEYYQGDFDEDSIHPKHYQRDCLNRALRDERQLHSANGEKVGLQVVKAIKAQSNLRLRSRYYSPYDYHLGVDHNGKNNSTDTSILDSDFLEEIYTIESPYDSDDVKGDS